MPFNSFEHYPMSWKPDRDRLQRPLYRSLALLLEHDIRHGFLAPGTKLPPQRELADFGCELHNDYTRIQALRA